MSWNDLLAEGEELTRQGDFCSALAVLKTALCEAEAGEKDNDQLIRSLQSLIDVYWLQNEKWFAESYLERLQKIMTKKYGIDSLMLVPIVDRLAELSFQQGDFARAEMFCRKAFYIQRSGLGADHSDTAITAYKLARVCHRRGNHEQAESFYKKTLSAKMAELGSRDPFVIEIMQNYAALLKLLHREEEAQHLLKCTLLVATS